MELHRTRVEENRQAVDDAPNTPGHTTTLKRSRRTENPAGKMTSTCYKSTGTGKLETERRRKDCEGQRTTTDFERLRK